MRAGDLRHILVFQQKPDVADETRDSFGAIDDEWPTAFTVPGLCTYKAGTENDDSRGTDLQKRRGTTNAEFLIRWKDGIDLDRHRISFDGHTWNITSIVPDPKRTQLTIDASFVI